MASSTTSSNEEWQRSGAQALVNTDYVLTEEEKMVLLKCHHESFMYRSVPFSVLSMAVTQALITRGTLSASPRFGSLPKLAFAGFFGYLAGKISYVKTCQEKFKMLENSPLGEALRQRTGQPPQYSMGPQSELSDPNTPSFDTMFQPAEARSMPVQTKDHGYGYSPEPPAQTRRADDSPVQSYTEEDEPRRKPIFYEDLRLKNRENYEVTLTQKADTLLKSPPEKEPERPRKEAKKNIYGDTWEE